ncbi:hypothetical protein CROQUDRAFT_672791 [Cronartium quercuum f. sp. fusiforme G11]|uniref:Uncharacterized protein n=1 Tax=Cronartium quercuum f. sp. fusiforme G11 TaxID=708437 RepID=A0A9P6T9K8_9BASI|nr:hypothetical protein CROQUDRAFT_672791 [Cronartium quercuum f. sp. fusiforme G11]
MLYASGQVVDWDDETETLLVEVYVLRPWMPPVEHQRLSKGLESASLGSEPSLSTNPCASLAKNLLACGSSHPFSGIEQAGDEMLPSTDPLESEAGLPHASHQFEAVAHPLTGFVIAIVDCRPLFAHMVSSCMLLVCAQHAVQ